jgi:hypothetical protein
MAGFLDWPRVRQGAFVEYGLSIPPLVVRFQFNPEELSRSRSLSYDAPNHTLLCPVPGGESEEQARFRTLERQRGLREYHEGEDDLLNIRAEQTVTVQEESISFDIRLDATDKLNDGDPLATRFGVAPQLATLELMVLPKSESILGELLLGAEPRGFSYTMRENPPIVLFVWGAKRVVPVNITNLSINETQFTTLLAPVRATVSVDLTVIEGANGLYRYSKLAQEALSVAGTASQVVDVVIPR